MSERWFDKAAVSLVARKYEIPGVARNDGIPWDVGQGYPVGLL